MFVKKSRSIGKTFRAMVVSAKNALSRKKEETNNMNVFPVPDGDTGINMSLTMSGASDVGENENENVTLGEAAEQAARGVSGVITKHIIANTEPSTEKMLKLNAFDKN